ncbi:MAG: winged helix-turn-helix transcriptional regulator [Chloroflexi bacterium]|nr:winged helix-turn-helix transcriptional regulator [Chloroflexota bacterium]
MSVDPIPDDVRRLILKSIDSVAQLEAVLLLRANPDVDWAPDALAKRLYVDEDAATAVLDQLCDRGFCVSRRERVVLYRYQPSTPDLDQVINRLAETYRQFLVPVTNVIHSKARSNVQRFADAFKMRKDG